MSARATSRGCGICIRRSISTRLGWGWRHCPSLLTRGRADGVRRAQHHASLQAGGAAAARRALGRCAGAWGGEHGGVSRSGAGGARTRIGGAMPRRFAGDMPDAALERVVQLGAGGAGRRGGPCAADTRCGAADHSGRGCGAGRSSSRPICAGRFRSRSCRGLRRSFGGDGGDKRPGALHADRHGGASRACLCRRSVAAPGRSGCRRSSIFRIGDRAVAHRAAALGCRTLDGGGMAVFQAVKRVRALHRDHTRCRAHAAPLRLFRMSPHKT